MLRRMAKHGAFANLIGQGGHALAGLLMFMLLARYFSALEFGSWVLFITIVNLLESLRMGLVRQGLVRALAAEAQDPAAERSWMGAAWGLSIMATGALVMLSGGAQALALHYGAPKGWALALEMTPWMLLAGLPHSVAAWRHHGRSEFWGVNGYRLFTALGFLLLFGTWMQWEPAVSLEQAAALLACLHGAASLWVLLTQPVHRRAWLDFPPQTTQELWTFGRHSLMTLTGSHLLRSTDQILLGLFAGPAAVAAYSIPLKLVQLAEVPVRAFSMQAYPRLSRALRHGECLAFQHYGWRWVVGLTLLALPFLGMAFLIPDKILNLIGGEVLPESVPVLAIFLIYMGLLPLDRFFGIALDSLGKPEINTGKVWRMLALNLLGDGLLLALGAPLWSIALVTIANTLLGIVWAYRFLRRQAGFAPDWAAIRSRTTRMV